MARQQLSDERLDMLPPDAAQLLRQIPCREEGEELVAGFGLGLAGTGRAVAGAKGAKEAGNGSMARWWGSRYDNGMIGLAHGTRHLKLRAANPFNYLLCERGATSRIRSTVQ